ncbi:serine/threonine protein kinase [Herpetosiphon llansteffanensis]|uniref:serine/threonine protein kinase n=1 Tax=Herpetosiphon llansteffanensis TaxID=2094568 RepID=UPI000D7C714D|nr:serine/threonine-protein kinase [Herpetosiphon llansteffanensis]
MSDLLSEENSKTGALPPELILGYRYLLKQRLGQGGMGAVYLAYDQRLDIDCAIKEMSTALLKTEDERERARKSFHEEAKLLARLNHPNLPRVTDHFSDHGREYLVMEFVPGETLASILRNSPPPWPVADVVAFAEPLTEVLHYLHSRTPPIVFRDLKPANIMRTPEGQVKLIDFGIARLFKPGQSQDTQAFGTMGYSAPEQYGTGQTDARSDVYALGVLLHQLMTGHDPIAQPFNVPLAHTINPAVSEAISSVLMTAMSHDPQTRFASMVALRRALSNASQQSADVYVAQRPSTSALPNVGYAQSAQARPVSQPYGQPSSKPYGQTGSQPYGQPSSQPYGQTGSQPYGQPSSQLYGQTGSQPYGPPVAQPYAQPYTPPAPPIYAQPFSPPAPPMHPATHHLQAASVPQAKTTGVAQTAQVMGFLSLIMVISGFFYEDMGYDTALLMASFGGFAGFVSLIVSIVAVSLKATRDSRKGRSQAVRGLIFATVAMVLACVVMGIIGSISDKY